MPRLWKGALAALALAAACLALTAVANASPAAPNTIRLFKQPNGKVLALRLWGDEFLHGWETAGGYTVKRDQRDGYWKYATRDRRGFVVPTRIRVGAAPPPVRRHLRPTLAAQNAVRRRQGAPPLGGRTLQAAPPWANSTGTKVLFIMVQFTDTACTFTPTQMQNNMFGSNATGPGNLQDFFLENSYGQFKMVGTVVGNSAGTGCAALGNNRQFYNDETTNADGDGDLVRAAVAAVDGYVDFSQYDNDNDGKVDALGLIYAGGGPHDGCVPGSNSNNLWPHSQGLTNVGGTATADGKTVDRFIINSEVTHPVGSNTCNQIQTIGLFAHEFGHSLGLPDLYDTDSSSQGVGSWTTMSSQFRSTTNLADTPPEYDAWSKSFEGWVTPIVHQPNDRVLESLSQVEDTGEVHEFRSNPGGVEIGGSGEYFLVENRQQTKFDAQLPGCGILIWHIDEGQSTNKNEGHTSGSHRLLDIEEADGSRELSGGAADAYTDVNNGGDVGDPFPGASNNSLFADSTTPTAHLYDGSNSNVRVRIKATACSSDMPVAFGPNQPPHADAGGPYTTNEGTDKALTAAASSDPDSDALTYAWDLDDDGQFDDSTSQTPTFTNVGDNGVFNVRVKVTDSFGDSDTASTTVTVNNVDPSVVNVGQDGPKPENDGTGVTVTATVTDPGWLDTLTATIDWGDGNGPQAVSGTQEHVRPDATLALSVSHNYGDNGIFSVKICGADDDGGSGCASTSVTVTNVIPTVTIDESGTVLVNGVPTVIAHSGDSVSLSGRSIDPGSDDLRLTWDWNDGSPNTSTLYLVNPPNAEPLTPSPSVQPRDVTDTHSHAFAACLYDVSLTSRDDDAGSQSDSVKVLIVGNSTERFSAGYWQRQYSGKPTDFTNARLLCYLKIAGFVSNVFNEVTNASTIAQAFDVLKAGGGTSAKEQFDRQLLAALINFANGDPAYNKPIDTNGDGTGDTPFLTVIADAETVRLNAASTSAQIIAKKDLLEAINLGKA